TGSGATTGTTTGTSTISSASEYRVYVDAPVNAELYVDGAYVGIVPISFEKKKGTYIISLRRDGYVTRSYNIEVDDSEQDATYSFSDLVREETE
ncbi:MAG: PEGA domain-containing protein, partial [Lachnospiraceae bacterium]|nr:PEGA domain-containing protein [Lachnospiraceae bacterium]